ncbi:MAG: hypothetical protein ACOCQW_04060 [Halanaerobiaceae bacterium]
MRLSNLAKFILIIILPVIICIPISSTVFASNSIDDELQQTVTIEGEISHQSYDYYKLLFKSDNFQLIGKLMTLFLQEENKGYKIYHKEKDTYYIQSNSTIQRNSYINIIFMDNKNFDFNGKLFIKKGIAFNSDIGVNIDYLKKNNRVIYSADIAYTAPVVVNSLNNIYNIITGEDFISYKIIKFLDNLHLVLDELNKLNPESWSELVNNEENFVDTVFSVEFSEKEYNIIENILKNDKKI